MNTSVTKGDIAIPNSLVVCILTVIREDLSSWTSHSRELFHNRLHSETGERKDYHSVFDKVTIPCLKAIGNR
jgi:hypothetical protein